jgi:hypothetical protein
MKFLPFIQRHWLFLIAGLAWTLVGFLLCGRAVGWLLALPLGTEMPLISASILIAGTGYYFGFSKVVKKNIARIYALPERAPFYAFTAPRGYILITIMVTTGVTLRNSALPKVYLTIPYLAMGCVLLIGSVRFYREFFRAGIEKN